MTVMGTTHTTQSVTTPIAPFDLNKFGSLKADAWWLTMSQVTDGDTDQRIANLYSAIAILCQMQTMLTRECSRILQEDNEITEQERYLFTLLD